MNKMMYKFSSFLTSFSFFFAVLLYSSDPLVSVSQVLGICHHAQLLHFLAESVRQGFTLIALVGLELDMWTRLDLKSKVCLLLLLSAGIMSNF